MTYNPIERLVRRARDANVVGARPVNAAEPDEAPKGAQPAPLVDPPGAHTPTSPPDRNGWLRDEVARLKYGRRRW